MSKTLREGEKSTTNLRIDYGFPVFMVSWKNIKYMILASFVLDAIVLTISLCLLYISLKMAANIAEFINLITFYDGFILPVCLFLVGSLCFIISSLMIFVKYKTLKRSKNEHLNNIFFIFIIICLVISTIVLALSIFTYVRKVTLSNRIQDGIIKGMQIYKTDCEMKNKIDALQLTFQCCGSRDYNDWFNIKWYDSPAGECMENACKDDTPFSCCSMHSRYPCIHHDIMSVGKAYLYAPESNLSISEYGCMPILKCYTKLLTSRTALCFLILALLLLVIASLSRFIQTAHMELYKFERDCHRHTSWLIGRYRGKKNKKCRKPPKPPPFSSDLCSPRI